MPRQRSTVSTTCPICEKIFQRRKDQTTVCCSTQCGTAYRWRSREDPVSRFWSFVDRSNPDGCWLWTGGHFGNGYPAFWVGGRTVRAHAHSYVMIHGPIAAGLAILHSCDTPSCVRPDHLRAGTQKENLDDARTRNRTDTATNGRHWTRAQRSEHGLLSAEQVNEIRTLATSGITQSAIAERFGVHQTTISRIVNQKRWAI